jgi:hypothetical protein
MRVKSLATIPFATSSGIHLTFTATGLQAVSIPHEHQTISGAASI